MSKGATTTEKIIFASGFLLILVTLLLNDRILVGIFPTYQFAVPASLKTGFVVADVFFVLAVLFILGRNKPAAKILLDVLVGVGFTLLLLAVIEIGFYFLNQQNQRQLENVMFDFISGGEARDVQFAGEHAQAFFQRDDWLGYRPVPDTQAVASRQEGDKTLYRVTYSIDSYGRRVTPVDELAPNSKHILFFGDSYTFGEGVNDNETMSFYVSELAPDYRGYNYGAGGYGPQQMLAKLQSEEISVEVDEDQGVLVYIFIGEHILRAIGSMRIHIQRGDVMPYHYLDTAGNLVRNGDLASGRPLLSGVYTILGQSQVLKFFNIDFPLRLRDEDLQLTAKIIEESRAVYQEKFNSDQFYVLIYPGLGAPELIPYLEAAGITYLNYYELPDIYDDDFWLGEGHPTAKAHRIVAEKLVQDLGLQNIGGE